MRTSVTATSEVARIGFKNMHAAVDGNIPVAAPENEVSFHVKINYVSKLNPVIPMHKNWIGQYELMSGQST